jgi:glycosyltransferase involved in cell wall biosynthesis
MVGHSSLIKQEAFVSRKKKRKNRADSQVAANGQESSTFPLQMSPVDAAPSEPGNTGVPSPQLIFDGEAAPAVWPSVTLCMIVKNEEKHLAACLQSVGDLADEIIVVDTGSTDGTIEIAQSFGAVVRHFTWVNDFAAARNESIREAKGEWIFWMDADDRLSPDHLIRLKQALASGKADAYYCYVVSQLQDKNVGEDRIEHLRLFRNRQGVQFERPLHEDAAPVAHRLGLVIARTNIVINHTGYATDDAIRLEKLKRNLFIIEEIVAKNPDDLQWRFHLGVTKHVLGDLEEAIEHLEAVVANPPPTLDREVYLYQAYEGLMLAYVDLGQLDKARRTLEQAMQKFNHRQHFWIRAATVYLALDEPEQAVEMLNQARALGPDAYGQSWATGTSEYYLCEAYLLLGDLSKAREAYLEFLAQSDKSQIQIPVETWLKAQVLFKAEQYDEVIELLQPLAEANSSALRLLAKAQAAHHNWTEAASFLTKAIALTGSHPGEWTDLAKYTLQAQSRALHAHRYCHFALFENPQDANALNLLGIIALAQDQTSAALSHFIQALLADSSNVQTQYNLQQICQSLNLSTAEALRLYGLQLMKEAPPNYAQAAAAFALMVKITAPPEQTEAYKLMAVALQKNGQEGDAFLCWQTAQQLEATHL